MAAATSATVPVRRATDADVAALVAIREAVAAEGRWIGRELPMDLDAEAAMVRRGIASSADRWVVTEAGGLLVGYGGVHADGAGHGELFMALLDGHRGQGLGTALVEDVVGWARCQPELHKLVLQVWPHNVAAIALYRRAGFTVEGYRHQHWRRANGELWDAIDMGLVVGS